MYSSRQRFGRFDGVSSVIGGIAVVCVLWGEMWNVGRAAEPEFLVGVARRDITPDEAVPMWGYGDRHAALSEGVLDPLTATAIVIQAGRKKLAIVGLDLGRSPDEASLQRIRERIAQEHGIRDSLIAGSHTHHGPVVELSDRKGRGQGRFDAAIRYRKKLEDAIVDAIGEAHQQLAPALMADASCEMSGFNRNRHSKRSPAPVDRTLNVLRFDRADSGLPIAVLVQFTGHPTSIQSDVKRFSADYVGGMRATIEKEHGGLALFMQGASGDISSDRGEHGDHIAYGQALGAETVAVLRTMTPVAVESPKVQSHEERFQFESRTDFRNPLVQGIYSVAFFPELIANFIDEYEDGIRPRVTVVLLNKRIALVGASGEFFCQHAIRLRERANVDRLFFMGYCNGYHQYFPTIEATAEGGYGADAQVAPAEIGAGEIMMNAALIALYRMQGKIAP
jgi:neutral ceramidase